MQFLFFTLFFWFFQNICICEIEEMSRQSIQSMYEERYVIKGKEDVLQMGDSGRYVYIGRKDFFKGEREVIQKGQVMVVGIKVFSLGVIGRIIEFQRWERFVSYLFIRILR